MNTWKPWQVVVLAIGLAVGFAYLPLITTIAAGILLVVYREAEVKNAVGQTKTFVTSLVLATGAAIVFNLILGWFFGTSLKPLVVAGGLPAILKNPGVLSSAVFKELVALIAVASVFYLWFTSEKPRRWLFKLALVVSLAYLGWNAWDAYAPLPVTSKARSHIRTVLIRQDIHRWWESWFKDRGMAISYDAMIRDLKAEVPPILVLVRDAPRWQEEGGKLVEKEIRKKGERFFFLPNLDGSPLRDHETTLPYARVALEADEAVTGYIRLDLLVYETEYVKQFQPIEVDKPNQKVASIAREVSPPPKPPVLPAPVITSQPKPRSTTRDDVVVAKVHEWTDSEVIPYPGDVIEFGPFKDPKDVNRLLCRVGGEPSIDLQPVELWDGRYVGRVTCEGGPNIIAAPQRVKVSSGQPLSVPIKKIRTY